MTYIHPQSGFTPTPNFRQSFVVSLKSKVTQSVFAIRNVLMGRELSSQPKKWCQGFSLIETLVAITILLIVIVGPLSITSTTARSTSFASDQVTAFFLAQEGAELIQKARDDLLLRQFLPPSNSQYLSNPWAQFTGGTLLQHCYTTQGCAIEINDDANGSLVLTSGSLPRCQSAVCRLYYNETSNITKRSRYTHTSASATITPFTRAIKITTISPFEIRVTSEVTWRSGLTSTEQRVSVVNHLFNIYAN